MKKIAGVRVLRNRLDTPRGLKRSAALVACTDQGAMYLHGMRHTSHEGVRRIAQLTAERGTIDPKHWVQVDVARYVLDGVFAEKGGRVIPGSGPVSLETVSDSIEEIQQRSAALPDVRAVRGGFALFPEEAPEQMSLQA